MFSALMATETPPSLYPTSLNVAVVMIALDGMLRPVQRYPLKRIVPDSKLEIVLEPVEFCQESSLTTRSERVVVVGGVIELIANEYPPPATVLVD